MLKEKKEDKPGNELIPEKETVSLNLIEADDTVSNPPKKEKLKDTIKSLFVTEDEKEEQTKKRKKKSTFFTKHLYIFVGCTIFICNLFWPEEWKQSFTLEGKEYSLAPSNDHINAIIEPLARIADRHTNISEINPDVTDMLASITAIVAYGLEIRSILSLKKYYEQEKKKEQETSKDLFGRKMIYANN